MIRTQIYLDDNLITNLRIGAKYNKTTVSEYVRQLLNEKISPISIPATKKVSPLLKLAKLASKDPKPRRLINYSGNIDKYLPQEWQ